MATERSARPPENVASQAMAVLAKDLRSELRSRSALNAILLFAVTALVVVGFAAGGALKGAVIQAALLWVILFFAAFAGLAHSFQTEMETGTWLALNLSCSPSAIYAGKLVFNLVLLLTIVVLVAPLFALMASLSVVRPVAFAMVVLFGSVGLGAGATFTAAILARAGGQSALYGALGFPLLLPLLLMAVRATSLTLQPGDANEIWRILSGLVAFATMLILGGALLFPILWED
jgi:heme exporter protein B